MLDGADFGRYYQVCMESYVAASRPSASNLEHLGSNSSPEVSAGAATYRSSTRRWLNLIPLFPLLVLELSVGVAILHTLGS